MAYRYRYSPMLSVLAGAPPRDVERGDGGGNGSLPEGAGAAATFPMSGPGPAWLGTLAAGVAEVSEAPDTQPEGAAVLAEGAAAGTVAVVVGAADAVGAACGLAVSSAQAYPPAASHKASAIVVFMEVPRNTEDLTVNVRKSCRLWNWCEGAACRPHLSWYCW